MTANFTYSTFTEQQREAWSDVVKLLGEHGVDISDECLDHRWHVEWQEETRPGRGHHFNGVFCDGEVFAQVLMDVYGYPSVSIADLSWVHIDADEEHECEVCVA